MITYLAFFGVIVGLLILGKLELIHKDIKSLKEREKL